MKLCLPFFRRVPIALCTLLCLLAALIAPATMAQRSTPVMAPEELKQRSSPNAADDPLPMASPSNTVITGVQGVVTLDVSVPDTIRAGEYISYTFTYTNTGASAYADVVVEALWASFYPTNKKGIVQYCDTDLCDVLSEQGPDVTRIEAPTATGARYRISSLAPGQSGRFTVRLLSRVDIYPQTGRAPTRPAGSGRLFLNSSSTPTSEDTASTLVVGPVLVVTKTASASGPIYPTQTAEFVIRVGNATGAGDVVGGQIRADARTATNIVLKDVFPAGSEFVSATGNPIVDTADKTVTWTIAGPLAPGQTVEVRVVFRKLDVNSDCPRLKNATYNATSDQYPFNGPNRYTVPGPAISVDVVIPLVIKSVTATPSKVVYGDEATITIVVQSFWSQPLNGIQLHYDLQSNAFYIPGSAAPPPVAAPNGTQPGGRVSWSFNMPAGSKTTPVETTFTLRVRGDYTSAGTKGSAQIVAPAGVPSACIVARAGGVGLLPRLSLTKYTDADEETKIDRSTYGVERGDEFPYIIDVTNSGSIDAVGVDVTDLLPSQTGASFSYVVGSSTLNGARRDPDSVVDGLGGTIIWNDLTIPAGATIRLRYRLRVDGRDYYRYCNTASAAIGSESIDYDARNVCVKINPQIEVTKIANLTATAPGQEVRFTLTLVNREQTPYRVGLYDDLGSFEFVRQESGYAQPTQLSGALEWPVVEVQPGAQIAAVIVARTPNVCLTRDYVNELLFHNDIDLIEPIPRELVKVRVTCGTNVIEYSKSSDRTLISLRDRVVYTLSIKNATPAAAVSNVRVDDVLPLGFTYVGMDGASAILTAPAQQRRSFDGRTRLTWTIPSIAPNTTVKVIFVARSGDVVGPQENWLTASAPDLLEARCKGTCRTVVEEGESITYAFRTVTVQPLITIEPKLVGASPDVCVRPGDTLTYQLSIVNTNDHDYASTDVSIILPFGLRFARPISSTATPSVSVNSAGISTVAWSGLRIPAKPEDTFAAQVDLFVELQVGQVWGDLDTSSAATSPDGLIPRKDGAFDPTVSVCAGGPAIAKDVSRSIVRAGDEIFYQISLFNPGGADITATIEDVLPEGFTFRSRLLGPAPSVNGSTLTWSNLTIPKASGDQPGLVVLRFRVQVGPGSPGTTYENTARVVSSSQALDTTYNSVEVIVARVIFAPILFRAR